MKIAIFLSVLAILLCPLASQAQLTITLDQQTESGCPGHFVFFSGGLTNGQDNPLNLDSVSLNFAGIGSQYFSALPIGDDPFFNGTVPLSLMNTADTFHGRIFGFSVADVAPLGDYDGRITITSNYDSQPTFDTFQDFRLSVVPPAVPERSTALGFGAGLLVLACCAARKRLTNTFREKPYA